MNPSSVFTALYNTFPSLSTKYRLMAFNSLEFNFLKVNINESLITKESISVSNLVTIAAHSSKGQPKCFFVPNKSTQLSFLFIIPSMSLSTYILFGWSLNL